MSAQKRNLLYNVIIAGVFIGLLAWLVIAATINFDYSWSWTKPLRYLVSAGEQGWEAGLLLKGFLMTLRLAVWGGIICVLLGLLLGLMSTSRIVAVRMLAISYVEAVRNMPPLVFIFVMYFFVSSQVLPPKLVADFANVVEGSQVLSVLLGEPSLVENFLAGLLTIAFYEAAYVGEIVRGGLQSIERGQWEASSALGLHRWATIRTIILPQALRKIVPPFTNQLISLVKDSSIISVISVQELTFSGIEVATTTGRLFETLILVAAMYMMVCYPASLMLRRYERPSISAL